MGKDGHGFINKAEKLEFQEKATKETEIQTE
jgi:hypothetical protein